MLKAGKYFVGDLCYVVPIEEWSTFIKEIFGEGETVRMGEHEVLGKYFVIANTAHGDGQYKTNVKRMLCDVDSGMIGALSVKDMSTEVKKIHRRNIVEFKEDFTITIENGDIHIGHIIIFKENLDKFN